MNVQIRRGGFSYDVYIVDKSEIKSQSSSDSSFNQFSLPLYPGTSLLKFHRIDFDLVGADPFCEMIAEEPSADYLNFYAACYPADGIRNVRAFQKVLYKNIYPAIDLEFLVTPDLRPKYNFILRPGGKVSDIRLKICGADGIRLQNGSLRMATVFGEIEEIIPESYVQTGTIRTKVTVAFRQVDHDMYGFSTDESVRTDGTLVIDPTCKRLWGTYYGGSTTEYGYGSAVDYAGNIFLAGITKSPDNIATAGAYQSTFFGSNWRAYLAKLTPGGTRRWGTYYAGSFTGDERGMAVTVDIHGRIYLAGETASDTGIATPGAHQTTFGGFPGGWDVFLAKFSQEGERLWATYYGGQGDDLLWGNSSAVTTDRWGHIFLAGQTSSDTGIATPGAFQTSIGGMAGFLAKFDSSGVRQWGTYYSGGITTWFNGCAADTAGNIYAAGTTNSATNIATPGAWQEVYGGMNDAFLVAFRPDGQRLWGTYYGGDQSDQGLNCKVTASGDVALVGWTKSSTNISSPGCHQPALAGDQDGFIARFTSAGQRIWGTYYGGSLTDEVTGYAEGGDGDFLVSGSTQSTDNIATAGSYQPASNGNYDAFLVKISQDGVRQWGTYFGGTSYETGGSCNYLADDTIFLQGNTQSLTGIGTAGSHQPVFGGGMQDAYLQKFIECWPIAAAQPIAGPDSTCRNTTGVVVSTSALPHAVFYQWGLPLGVTITAGFGTPSITVTFSDAAESGYITVRGVNKCNDAGPPDSLFVTVSPRPVPLISGPASAATGAVCTYTTASGMISYQWTFSPGGVLVSGGGAGDDSISIRWNTAGPQWVRVNYNDTNGCSALMPFTLTVTVGFFASGNYEFWFAAPAVTHQTIPPSSLSLTNLNSPISIYFTTDEGPADVTIDQPANPLFTPITCTVENDSAEVVILTPYLEMIENKPADSVLNFGLRAVSNRRITAAYEIQSPYNAATYTLAGKDALGTSFIIPAQHHYSNYPYCSPPARNSFDIVATEDSTLVTVIPERGIEGHTAQVPYTLLLNRGQTWSGRAVSGDSTQHLGGTKVNSTKPIAITVTDDAVFIPGYDETAFDLAGEQIIPEHLAGNEFIALAMSLPPSKTMILAYAYEDGTHITFNDSLSVQTRVINQGESAVFSFTDTNVNAIGIAAYITSNKPVSILEFSGAEKELTLPYHSFQASESVIPPLECHGSRRATITSTPPGAPWHNWMVYVVAKMAILEGFTFDPSSMAINVLLSVPGTGGKWGWGGFGIGNGEYFFRVKITNSLGRFFVPLHSYAVMPTGNFDKFAYFSDISSLNLGNDRKICPGDSVFLDAGYGWNTYVWSTGATSSSIWVHSPGTYWVSTSEPDCQLSDTIN
ncbi:MAG TPA: hypothetical protein PLK82_10925, partial [Bacteroidales bacterium]|nr:hypothetical protein [Bacteroidales bacterium]